MNTIRQNRVVRLTYGVRFFVLLAFCLSASAASFDCSKSTGRIEMQICSDTDLSRMDSELAIVYSKLKKSNIDLVNQQKTWLREIRNLCQTTSCLMGAYSHRIAELRQHNICPVNEKVMLGSWGRVKNGFFEEMGFYGLGDNKKFISWLHHNPEMSGRWEIVDCTLKIIGDDEKIRFDFKIDKFENGKLYIFDVDDKKTAIYKKFP